MTSKDRRIAHLKPMLLGFALAALAALAPAAAIAKEPASPSGHGVVYGGIVVECRDAQTGPIAQETRASRPWPSPF